jgi:hypothetical protein
VSTSGVRGITAAVTALLIALLALDSGCRAARVTPPAAPTGPDPLAAGSHRADAGPPGAVLTQRGDETRLGWYSGETRLTVGSVGGGHFGKLANLSVDGKVYAQPLYVPGLTVGGAPHDVVIVATEHDSLYAFDADATGAAAPLWHTSLLAPGARPMLAGADRVANNQLCDSIVPEVGITGTPVIDWSTRTLYAVAVDVESGRLTYRVHAVDIATGTPRRPSTVISATVDGRALDSGTLRVLGKCLDAYNNQTTNGTKVEIWSCNGGANQQWTYNSSNGTIVGAQSGKCVTVQSASTSNGALLILYTCNGGGNQKWTRQ